MRAGVLTKHGGDGGTTAFCEADGGRNGGISSRAAGVACGRGRGELGGAELRWPLGVAGSFAKEKWREGGSQLGDGEARRGKKNGGMGSDAGGATWR
jgi:hypothetical protein